MATLSFIDNGVLDLSSTPLANSQLEQVIHDLNSDEKHQNSRITKLFLSGCQLDANNLPNLKFILSQLPLLRSVDLSFNNLNTTCGLSLAADLPQWECHQHIKTLNLSGNLLCDVGLDVIFSKCVQLESLQVQSCGLTAHNLSLSSLSLPTTLLTSLDISFNHLGDQAAVALASSLVNPKGILMELNLAGTGLSEQGVNSVLTCLPRSKLIQLDISNNIITPTTLAILAQIISNEPFPNLEKITLGILLFPPRHILPLARSLCSNPTLEEITLAAPINLRSFHDLDALQRHQSSSGSSPSNLAASGSRQNPFGHGRSLVGGQRNEAIRMNLNGQNLGSTEVLLLAVLLQYHVGQDCPLLLDLSENMYSSDAYVDVPSCPL